MTTSEKIKPLKLNNWLNTDEFNEMRVKLKNLRQKVSKNKHIKLENINWNYPLQFSEPKRASADTSLVSSPKTVHSPFGRVRESFTEKVALISIPHSGRKMKRVPPPNFMIGMRDLNRVYNDSDTVHIAPHYRKMSS